MARANAAYYARHDFARDFATGPEITQVFGELVGLWCAVVWDAMGRPDPVRLIELGPGRGTLMRDARRAISARAPEFQAACRLHLVEQSPRLRAMQAELFPDATIHGAFEYVPAGPFLLIGNEFLDVLPVRQLVRRGDGWTERFVADDAFVEQPTLLTSALSADEGEVAEVGEAARALMEEIGSRVVRDGGAALFLDYGPAESAAGDSLQAIREGRSADPLADPGRADVTAHVDFPALAAAAQSVGAAVHGPVPQGLFLAHLGLFQRTHRLTQGLPPERADPLIKGARRLAEPDGMGRLFKALAVSHPDLPPLPGFEM